MTNQKDTEARRFESLERLLNTPRDRDDYQGHMLSKLLKESAALFPRQYKQRWIKRLQQQPEAYWTRPLQSCTTIEDLMAWHKLIPCGQFTLTINDATDADTKYLARQSCTASLSNLTLSGETLSTTSVHALLSKRCKLDALRGLNLKGHVDHMGDRCARLFAETKKFQQLESLSLSYNGIQEPGIILFSKAKHYPSLTRLELVRVDRFTEAGLQAMIQATAFSKPVRDYHQSWLNRYFPQQ